MVGGRGISKGGKKYKSCHTMPIDALLLAGHPPLRSWIKSAFIRGTVLTKWFRYFQQGQRQMQTSPNSCSGLGTHSGSSTWHPTSRVSSNQGVEQQTGNWGQTSLPADGFETSTRCYGSAPHTNILLASKTRFYVKSTGKGLKGDVWFFVFFLSPLLAILDLELVRTRQTAFRLLSFVCDSY